MAKGTKVSIIPMGAMHADITWLLLKPGVAMRPRQAIDTPSPWVEVPTHCVLVDTPDGRLLWDTSCPADWEERWGPTGLQDFFPYDAVSDEELFESRMKQLGLAANDVDMVVLSHLHFDHAGNAQFFKDSSAKLVVSKAEKDFAQNFEGPFNGAHLKVDYEGLEFDTVEGDTEILPGVTLLQTPGHTVGTMSMQVELEDTGTMIFTSDAVYMGDSYGTPAIPAGIVANLEDWFTSVEKLKGIQEKTDATMVFGHDAEQIHQLRTMPDGSYT